MEVLADQCWTIGHTTKGWGSGVALDKNGKPRKMTGDAFNRRKSKPITEGIINADYAANFEDFLNTTTGAKPWCFW